MISTIHPAKALLSLAFGVLTGLFVLAASWLQPEYGPILVIVLLVGFVAIVLGIAKKLLLLVILFDLSLQVDIYLNYRAAAAEMNSLPGLNLSIMTGALALLYLAWIFEIIAKKASLPPHLLSLSLPSLVYLAVVTVSASYAKDVELAVFAIALLVQAVLLFIYIQHALSTREDLVFIMTVLAIILAVQGLIMAGLYLYGSSVTVSVVLARIDPSGRVGGTIGSPNSAASFLTMLLAPMLGFYLARPRRLYRLVSLAAFSLGGIGLLLTLSRGGLLGFSISMLVFVYFAWRRGLIGTKIPFAIAILALLAFVFLRGQILQRLTDDEGAAYSRIPLAQMAMAMIADQPVLGVGMNNFAASLPDYVTPEFTTEWISTVHNKYLLVWSETGLLGLLAFLWFLAAALRSGFRVWLLNDPLLSPVALGFTSALVGFMGHMFFDLFHSRPQTQILWLGAGILAALSVMGHAVGVRAEQPAVPGVQRGGFPINRGATGILEQGQD